MKMYDWNKLSVEEKKRRIVDFSAGLKTLDIIESLDFIDKLIGHLSHVFYDERLPRYSIKAAVEYLRWRTVAADNSRNYKISNTLTADISHFLHRLFNEEMQGWIKICQLN